MRRRKLTVLIAVALSLGGCATHLVPPGAAVEQPRETEDAFIMPDGMRLPYRTWLPDGELANAPWAVVLALHGMNDSRDAWEYPGPEFAARGVAVFAPDQRGFGATSVRGYWPGTQALVDDAREMALLLHRRFPRARLILMGESMGAAVMMRLATGPQPPPAAGYVLVAPAVWGRVEMNVFLRASLWLASSLVPGLTVTGRVARVTASDNKEAIRRLSQDPLTIQRDTVRYGQRTGGPDGRSAWPPHRDSARRRYSFTAARMSLIPDRATAATWRRLPPGSVRAFYPAGYHLLLRDLHRVTPIDDILAWICHPDAPLPSGADRAAAEWLAGQD